MNTSLRAGTPDDAVICGKFCFEAFKTISNNHNFIPDLPSVEMATGLISMLLSRQDLYSVVAEVEGKVVGSNFLWEGDAVAGVGPITIDPNCQSSGIGKRLMKDVLERSAQMKFGGTRLVQATFNGCSLSLYTKLGFDVREPLACIQGAPLNRSLEGFPVRAAMEADVEECSRLCRRIHGHDRKNELLGSIEQNTATVVELDGRVTGYSSGIGFFTHTVAETNDGLKALIAAAPEITGPGFLLPTRNGEVFRWCLKEGLRVMQPMTLMSHGLYNEPCGAFLPSILL